MLFTLRINESEFLNIVMSDVYSSDLIKKKKMKQYLIIRLIFVSEKHFFRKIFTPQINVRLNFKIKICFNFSCNKNNNEKSLINITIFYYRL